MVDIVGGYVGDGVGIEVQAADNEPKGIQQMVGFDVSLVLLVAVVRRSDDSCVWYRIDNKNDIVKFMKGLGTRKERIDADVMERYKARCGKCVNVASDGEGLYFCRFNKTGNYVAVMTSGVMKEDCKHYKRKV